jgi:hypothetical protein
MRAGASVYMHAFLIYMGEDRMQRLQGYASLSFTL